MRTIVSIFLILTVAFTSCSKNEDTTEVTEMGIPSGNFISAAHTTTGTAEVSTDGSKLFLKNFKTDAGPLLEVYLSNTSLTTSNKPDKFISLGELTSVQGDFSYNIPQGTDLDTLKYVVIWCVEFNVNFGYAGLNQ